MKVILAVFFLIILNIGSQETGGKVYIGEFLPFNSEVKSGLEGRIQAVLESYLAKQGYSTEKISDVSPTKVKDKVPQTAHLYIAGYYTKKEGKNLSIFAQIYHPGTGDMIDAVNIEDEWEGSGENLKLPKEETSESDEKVLEKFGKKAGLRIRVNSSRKVNNENIDQYLTNHPLSKSAIFPITKDDKAQASQEVFKLLEDIEVVTATKTKTKIKDAPAAVYVITADQIRERGYKILSEALQDVPGFDFQHTYGIYPQLVHQRGLVGENNRTLVYVDGIADNNINEFGAIAGTIQFPLQNVERIEIVSGPSSSLYGAN
ncbi:MAG TPA: Plug domain-containing protein, partial [Leptospiraceae bacterium]|nr:Plug domain-containing protein [Leptospiraceae bacterium]